MGSARINGNVFNSVVAQLRGSYDQSMVADRRKRGADIVREIIDHGSMHAQICMQTGNILQATWNSVDYTIRYTGRTMGTWKEYGNDGTRMEKYRFEFNSNKGVGHVVDLRPDFRMCLDGAMHVVHLAGSCSCPDWLYRRSQTAGICKHIVAAQLLVGRFLQ